ncbi:MAG TPA: hypothetical protein VL098_06885 [Flavipsychrobacter sp.]|nr:hypothetical protein [Flavipsychrobacter sp.]
MPVSHTSLQAKTCYSRSAASSDRSLPEAFVEKEWLARRQATDNHYFITEKGKKEFSKPGVYLIQIRPRRNINHPIVKLL